MVPIPRAKGQCHEIDCAGRRGFELKGEGPPISLLSDLKAVSDTIYGKQV